MKNRPRPKFRGFPEPKTNFTGIPNVFFDKVLPDLETAGELKVLLYIFRHTYGWRKDCDCISISQFMEGIVTRRGRQLDRGTGLAKSTVVSALKSVVEQEYVFRYIAGRGSQRQSYFFLHTDLNREIVRGLEKGTLSIEQVLGSKFGPKFGPKFKPNSPDGLGSDFGHTKKRDVQKKKDQYKESNPQTDPVPDIADEAIHRMMLNQKRRQAGYTGQSVRLGDLIQNMRIPVSPTNDQ